MKQLFIVIQILLASISLSGQMQENCFVSLPKNRGSHSIVLNAASLRSRFGNMLLARRRLEPNAERLSDIRYSQRGMHDFITLFNDNYPEFIKTINEHVCQVKKINKETYLQWMATLHETNKSYKIAEQGKEQFVAASCVLENGKVKFTLKRATGETTIQNVYVGGGDYITVITPVYKSENVILDYDEPVALYHNKHIKGVTPGLLGTTEIVPAIQLHYYLGTSSDQVAKDAIWTTIDVATLFVGVGEIGAGVKGIRLALAITNTASSATSLAATLGENYFINKYGQEGQDYINALHIISAATGFMDLGYNGVRLLKNIYNKELVTIGRFYKKNGQKMLTSSNTNEKEIGRITKEIVDDFDEELIRLINLGDAGDLIGIRILNYTTTSGTQLVGHTNKTTTILGRWIEDMQYIKPLMKTEDFNVGTAFGKVAENKDGFNVLDITDDLYQQAGKNFFKLYNEPWLKMAVDRGDDIVLATKPTREILFNIDGSYTGNFTMEIEYLINKAKPINVTEPEWLLIKTWFKK